MTGTGCPGGVGGNCKGRVGAGGSACTQPLPSCRPLHAGAPPRMRLQVLPHKGHSPVDRDRRRRPRLDRRQLRERGGGGWGSLRACRLQLAAHAHAYHPQARLLACAHGNMPLPAGAVHGVDGPCRCVHTCADERAWPHTRYHPFRSSTTLPPAALTSPPRLTSAPSPKAPLAAPATPCT